MDSKQFIERVLSILLPTVSLLIELRLIGRKYRPIIYWILLKCIAEVVVSIALYVYPNLGISSRQIRNFIYVWYNLFVLFELFLLFWMFYEFKNKQLLVKRIYGVLLAICLIVFIGESISYGGLDSLLSWYRILVSFIFVFIAVDHINYLLVNERRVVWKSAEFLVCFGLVLYFCYKLLVEIFTEYADDSMKSSIYLVQLFVLIIFNIILLFAVLCLPRKQDITRYLS
jgi:hypothetical protein